MDFFVVPSDYREESHPLIIPICIAANDSEGNPVNQAWIEEGVVPVAETLRNVAYRELGDFWRVSEITEPAVHWLNRKHRATLPDGPSYRVLCQARSYAADLRVGGRRVRTGADVQLIAATLERLREPRDPEAELLARDTVNRLFKALDREQLHDIKVMAMMMMFDDARSAFDSRFQGSRNTLSHRFFRVMRRVAAENRITWRTSS